MKRLYIAFISILVCAALLCCGIYANAASAVQVASECDISDLEVPIDASVTDAAIGQKLEINAKSAVLLEVNTGTVLYEMNADEQIPPASITKIMSLLLIMEAIDRGDISLEDVVTVSEHAASMGGSQIWLEPGESMTVDDLLKAAVIASANDATVALGELVAGSEEGFVAQMNAKAQSLGMTGTEFKNATGLDAEGHKSTAHDVAVMSAELIKHELIKNYSTVWMDTLRDGKTELVNTNKLVRFYDGTTGLKTGTTSGAGYCLSATAERGGLSLAAVIMSGNTSADRFNGAKKLLDYGFANYSYSAISAELPENFSAAVEGGVRSSVKADAQGAVGLLLKKSEISDITQQINLNKISSPVKKGDIIGSVIIKNGDEEVGSIKITAAEDLPRMTFFVAFKWLLGGLFAL